MHLFKIVLKMAWGATILFLLYWRACIGLKGSQPVTERPQKKGSPFLVFCFQFHTRFYTR